MRFRNLVRSSDLEIVFVGIRLCLVNVFYFGFGDIKGVLGCNFLGLWLIVLIFLNRLKKRLFLFG